MFETSPIARYIRQWQHRRRRAATVKVLSALTPEVQKDIGWPAPAGPAYRDRTGLENDRRQII